MEGAGRVGMRQEARNKRGIRDMVNRLRFMDTMSKRKAGVEEELKEEAILIATKVEYR